MRVHCKLQSSVLVTPCQCYAKHQKNMGQNTSAEKVILEGNCDAQYEPVKEKLKDMLENGLEENLQLCVYVDGKCVIDLYGSAKGDTNYNAESIQVRIQIHLIKN